MGNCGPTGMGQAPRNVRRFNARSLSFLFLIRSLEKDWTDLIRIIENLLDQLGIDCLIRGQRNSLRTIYIILTYVCIYIYIGQSLISR